MEVARRSIRECSVRLWRCDLDSRRSAPRDEDSVSAASLEPAAPGASHAAGHVQKYAGMPVMVIKTEQDAEQAFTTLEPGSRLSENLVKDIGGLVKEDDDFIMKKEDKADETMVKLELDVGPTLLQPPPVLTWQDIRAKTKSRQAAIVQDSRRTAGGPPLALLNIEEQQVLAVIEPMDIAGERSLIESAVQIDFQEVGNPDVPEESSIESPSILTQSPPPMILLQSQNILTPNVKNSQNEQTPSSIQSRVGNVAQSVTNSRHPRRHFITNAQRRLQSFVNATQLLSEQGTEIIQIKREYMSMKREYYAAKLKIMNDNLSVQKEQLNILRDISTTLSTWK